jgi:hypothetical protein
VGPLATGMGGLSALLSMCASPPAEHCTSQHGRGVAPAKKGLNCMAGMVQLTEDFVQEVVCGWPDSSSAAFDTVPAWPQGPHTAVDTSLTTEVALDEFQPLPGPCIVTAPAPAVSPVV